jgi:predicted metal-binding membrane protein
VIPVLTSLRRIDIVLITSALVMIVALAWLYLYFLAREMDAMDAGAMSSMSHSKAWTLFDFLLMFVMWSVMMIGMMVPTALRAVMIYAGVAGQAESRGTPLAATGWFVLGYVLVWTGFSFLATVLQSGLHQFGLLSPMMASASPLLGASLLLAAGIYQLTPWKDVCLRHCQTPAVYLAGKFTHGAVGAVSLGIRHGGYCLGCCWVLMGLLFLGGVMNLVWIAAITLYVLLEKLLPSQWRAASVSGWLMIGSATLYIAV